MKGGESTITESRENSVSYTCFPFKMVFGLSKETALKSVYWFVFVFRSLTLLKLFANHMKFGEKHDIVMFLMEGNDKNDQPTRTQKVDDF